MPYTEEDRKKKRDYYIRVRERKRQEKEKECEERINRSLLRNDNYWKPLKNFHEKFLINRRGNIFRLSDMKFSKPCLNDTGYWRINLRSKDDKLVQCYLHRVVADTFLGGVREGDVVEFKDGNIQNVHASNLHICRKGERRINVRRTTQEAERNILEKGHLKEIVMWFSEDGEYHDQRTPFAAKCFNNHIVIGNYWDYGGKTPATGCKYCVRNIPQLHAEAESVLYDSGLVKDVLYFHTPTGKYENSNNLVTYTCYNDHIITKPFATQRYTNRRCKWCLGAFWGSGRYEELARFHTSVLYICKFTGRDEKFYKVGVSIYGASVRFQTENIPWYNIEPMLELRMNAVDAYNIEQAVLSQVSHVGIKHKPKYSFGGQSECFDKKYMREVVEMVKSAIISPRFFGEDNPCNKLSEEAVKFIKTNCKPNHTVFNITNTARMFKVHRKTIWNILNGITWKSVQPYEEVIHPSLQ